MLVIFFWVTNYARIYWHKTTFICHCTISVGYEFMSSLVEWLWIKIFHEVVIEMSADLQSSVGLNGAGAWQPMKRVLQGVGTDQLASC